MRLKNYLRTNLRELFSFGILHKRYFIMYINYLYICAFRYSNTKMFKFFFKGVPVFCILPVIAYKTITYANENYLINSAFTNFALTCFQTLQKIFTRQNRTVE